MINASFEKVEKVEKHPNADKLDIVTVSGYTVVYQKDVLKVGDLVFFIREDSQILLDEEKFPWHTGIKTYLGKSGRVKTIKLRGVYSSGIVIPKDKVITFLIAEFGMNNETIPGKIELDPRCQYSKEYIMERLRLDNGIHIDYNELNKKLENEEFLKKYCGIQHYTPPVLGTSFGQLQMVGAIPFGIPKTDEENVQNLPKEDIPFGEEVLVTRKIDGTSCTVIFDYDGNYHICGRNYEYKKDTDNIYINNTKDIIDWVLNKKDKSCWDLSYFKPEEHLVIQGEIAGKGIQANKINKISQTEEPKFYVFRIMLWNEKDRSKVIWGNYGDGCHFHLFASQINTVPILGTTILTQELIDKYINAPAEEGEGVVINHKNGHFKIKSLDYISKF